MASVIRLGADRDLVATFERTVFAGDLVLAGDALGVCRTIFILDEATRDARGSKVMTTIYKDPIKITDTHSPSWTRSFFDSFCDGNCIRALADFMLIIRELRWNPVPCARNRV